MNYLKIYNNIINKRKIEKPIGYKEKHHIIPRCLNGTDENKNLIELTAREHYICHLLLVKIYKNTKYYYKLLNAFLMMNCKNTKQNRYYNSRLYEFLRTEFSNLMHHISSGYNNSNYEKIWLNNKKLQISKSVKKEEVSKYLLGGWEIGRIINWESYKKQKLYKLVQILNKKIKQYNKSVKKKYINKNKHHKLKDRMDKNRELYNFYYQEYNKLGWVYFKEKYNYTKTQQNFVAQLKRYVKDFKPQDSKKRGDKNLRYNPYKDK